MTIYQINIFAVRVFLYLSPSKNEHDTDYLNDRMLFWYVELNCIFNFSSQL